MPREAGWLVRDHTTRQCWDKNLSPSAWTLESPLLSVHCLESICLIQLFPMLPNKCPPVK